MNISFKFTNLISIGITSEQKNITNIAAAAAITSNHELEF